MKFLIDRKELPYDAMVADESWLVPIEDEEEGDPADDAETKEVQTDQIHGKDIPL